MKAQQLFRQTYETGRAQSMRLMQGSAAGGRPSVWMQPVRNLPDPLLDLYRETVQAVRVDPFEPVQE